MREGSYTANRVGRGNYIQFNWQLAGQDIAGNFSLINWQAYAVFTRSDSQLDNGIVNTNVGQVYANGGRVKNYEGNFNSRHHLFANGQVRVNHRDDGNAEFQIGGGISFYGIGRSEGTSQVYNLPTIPRQSNPTFSKSLYTLGETITVRMNRKAGFLHNGNIQIPDTNKIKEFRNIADEFSWTPNETEIDEIYKRMPNDQKASLGVDITTWNGGTQIGGVGWQNVVIQLDEEKIRPDFSDFNFLDTNPKSVAITGNSKVLISGASKLRAEILANQKAVAKKYASMQKYNFEIAGIAKQAEFSNQKITVDLGEVKSTTNQVLRVSAIDSRGILKNIEKNIQILPYENPVLNLQAERLGKFEDATTVRISGQISLLKVGNSNKNSVQSLKIHWREANSGTWSNFRNISSTLNAENGTISTTDFKISLDKTKTWEIEAILTDKLNEVRTNFFINVGVPILFIDKNAKIGVNKLPELGDLDVKGAIFSGGKRVLTQTGDKSLQEQRDYYEWVEIGYGFRALFWKYNGIVGFTLHQVGSYGTAKMGEKLPEKFWPKHNSSFAGICINTGNHSGGFVLIFNHDGSIEKRGTSNHQEYHCSGTYLAQNDL